MITRCIKESIAVKTEILNDPALIDVIGRAAGKIVACYRANGKVLLCGNGGSAADAQHIAAELSGKYYFDRPPLYAEALQVNTSYITAVANDYSYDEVFARYIRAAGQKNDILIGISTSGNSGNIIKAIEAAKEIGLFTIGLTGASGGKMKDTIDLLINVPSGDTPRIQELHILIGHIICEIVETTLFSNKND